MPNAWPPTGTLNVYAGVQRAAAIAKSSDPSLADYFAAATAESVTQTNDLQKRLEEQMDQPAERALFEKIGTARKGYLSARDTVYRLKKDGDAAGALKFFDEQFEPGSRAYLAMVQQLVDYQRQQLDDGARSIDELRTRATRLLIGCAALTLGLSALLAWRVTGSITRPLRRAETMAPRDCRDGPQRPGAEPLCGRRGPAACLHALDAMRGALQQALNEVRGVADGHLHRQHADCPGGNHDLSSRTEQAASSLQQTAGSMEELTAP